MVNLNHISSLKSNCPLHHQAAWWNHRPHWFLPDPTTKCRRVYRSVGLSRQMHEVVVEDQCDVSPNFTGRQCDRGGREGGRYFGPVSIVNTSVCTNSYLCKDAR
jgi:hypothetical protein